MKTWQTKTSHPSKQWRTGFWISHVVLLLGLPLLLYYAYCWGLWGRNSLLLQLLFQCGCPQSSYEFRYPEHVDVVVSACGHNGVILSPSGRLLYVKKYTLWGNAGYFWNMQTNEKISYAMQKRSNYFLTDDLLFHEYDEYILDRVTGIQYPVQEFGYWHPDAYVNGDLNLNLLTESLRNAEDVFVIYDNTVVALGQDFRAHPELNFFVRQSLPGSEVNQAEQFLRQNNIEYIYIPDIYSYSHEAISPNGKFIARKDGIYLFETGQKIVEGFSATGQHRPASNKYFWVLGWSYDGTGAIYSKGEDVCLIEMNIFVSDVCVIKVPQPVLLLKIPDEYLLPLR